MGHGTRRSWLVILLFVSLAGQLVAASASHAVSPSFTPLGDLPGGTFESFASAVSADGSVVAGLSSSSCVGAICNSEAYIWQANSMTGLGFPPSNASFPFSGVQAVSANGRILAGSASSNEGTNEPFRWENGVFTRLGRIPGYGTNAHLSTGISDDGRRIVGWGESADGASRQAWLWENGAMVGLGTISGMPGSFSHAWGISGDGNVVVGDSDDQAFRWSAGAMTGLGYLPPPIPGPDIVQASWATAASCDGSVIVGGSRAFDYEGQDQLEAFRWFNGIMTGLGDLPGSEFRSFAIALSADGQVVVGQGTGAGGEVAFVWDEAHGMRDLRDVLASDFGLNLTGWTLRYASDISADGTVIVGTGINPDGNYEAFRAVIPEPTGLSMLVFGASVVFARRRGHEQVRDSNRADARARRPSRTLARKRPPAST